MSYKNNMDTDSIFNVIFKQKGNDFFLFILSDYDYEVFKYLCIFFYIDVNDVIFFVISPNIYKAR